MGEMLNQDRLIVYVDGFNLYHGLHDATKRELLWLDLVALAKSLRPNSSLVQVKYFTAMVLGDPDAQSRQDRYISAVRTLHPGSFTPVIGKYMSKRRRCHECDARWVTYEEKQTDVNIAVHLVADVAAQRADTYMLITADTDVIPAIQTARRLDPRSTIIAQFPPRRESKALKRMLPSSRQITLARIRDAQMPDLVEAPNGMSFARPEKWSHEPDQGGMVEEEVPSHACRPSPASVAAHYASRPPSVL